MTRTELLASTRMPPIITGLPSQGETDTRTATSRAAYIAAHNRVVADARAAEIVMASGTYAFLAQSPAEVLRALELGRVMWQERIEPAGWPMVRR